MASSFTSSASYMSIVDKNSELKVNGNFRHKNEPHTRPISTLVSTPSRVTLNNYNNSKQETNESCNVRFATRKSQLNEQEYEEKEAKLKNLELSSTVGTGTFGRVMVARSKDNTNEYYALKIMSISDIIKLKQIEHVKNEKIILEQVNHPFIVKLFWTHHNEQYLYMCLEYIPGGELFTLLRKYTKFETKAAVFYAAEIVCAFEYLHNLNIIYRDLKPENILLDRDGHLKLTDFGFAKKVPNKTFTLCGTPEYLAPEVIQNKGHGCTVDWWALGTLIYEMLAGSPPFYDEDTFKVYDKILHGKMNEWPRYFDFSAKDIIKKFLISDPSKRLGSGNMSQCTTSFIQSANSLSNDSFSSNQRLTNKQAQLTGADEVKRHRWFVSINNWDDVLNRKLKPPFIPKVSFDGDTSNFEKYDTPDLNRAAYASEREIDIFYMF